MVAENVLIRHLIPGEKEENETEKYCGSDKPDYQVIYNDTVEVTFSSDFSVQYSGFTLKYMLSKIFTKVNFFRTRLHQTSASTQSQRWDDAGNIDLIEKCGIAPKWVATPILEGLDLFPLFSIRTMLQASLLHRLCVDSGTWCKRALSLLNVFVTI